MQELTAWTEYQLPDDTGTPSHVELRMEAVYNTIKRRVRARQQGDLLNVKLIMRAYDPLTLVSSDSQDYPLIFKPSGSAGPRIIYNQNRIPHWMPEGEDGDMLVQPGTTEWRQVDDILSHFEDLDT
jgi:hypothetical protein